MTRVRRLFGDAPLLEKIKAMKSARRKKQLLQMKFSDLEKHYEKVLESRSEVLQNIHENETVIEKEEEERRAMHVEYVAVFKELDSYSTLNPNQKKWIFTKNELAVIQENPELTKKVFEVVEKTRQEYERNPRDYRLELKILEALKQFEEREYLVHIAFQAFFQYVEMVEWASNQCRDSKDMCVDLKMHWENTIVKKMYSIDFMSKSTFSDWKMMDVYTRKEELTKRKRNASEARKYREIEKLRKLYEQLKKLRLASQEEIEDRTCMICLEEIEKNKTFEKLPKCTSCRRRFHRTCLEQWFQKNSQCGVCKRSIYGFVNVDYTKFRKPYDSYTTEVEGWWTNLSEAFEPQPGDEFY